MKLYKPLKLILKPIPIYAANNKDYKANPEAYKGNIGDLAEILRITLTGRKNAPNLCVVMYLLGLEETHRRIDAVISLLK